MFKTSTLTDKGNQKNHHVRSREIVNPKHLGLQTHHNAIKRKNQKLDEIEKQIKHAAIAKW
jgi:hypothetical protein